jgi:hypothetical protein
MTKQEQFLAKAGVAANIILTAGAVASALVFVNSYYRYHWTGERDSALGGERSSTMWGRPCWPASCSPRFG